MNQLIDFVKCDKKITEKDIMIDHEEQKDENECKLTIKKLLFGSRSSNRVVMENLKSSLTIVASTASGVGAPLPNKAS